MFAFHGRLSRFRACPAGNLCSGECMLYEETEIMEVEQPGLNKDLHLLVCNHMHLLAFIFFYSVRVQSTFPQSLIIFTKFLCDPFQNHCVMQENLSHCQALLGQHCSVNVVDCCRAPEPWGCQRTEDVTFAVVLLPSSGCKGWYIKSYSNPECLFQQWARVL